MGPWTASLLCLVCLLHHPATAWSQNSLYTFEGAFNIVTDFVGTTLSTITQTAGLSDSCPFRDNMAESVKDLLPQFIRGQNEAIEIIINAVASWEFGKKSGKSDPLVLALTGSTGIGKSETAFRLAESIFLKSSRVGQSRRFIPNGLLILRGEDYSDISEAGAKGLGEIHDRIKSLVARHLQKCEEKAIIVFDEIQKVMPGTLEVLMPALEEKGTISYTDAATRKTSVYSTSQVIFVLISDIGAERMTRLLLKYQTRSAIPINILRNEVKQTLDEQWQKLQFGRNINEVVPFLPMEQPHIQDVLLLKFNMLSQENKFVYWLDLVVDDGVIQHLSSPHFLKYVNHTAKTKPNNSTLGGSSATTSKVFAKYGARALETGGPLQDLKALFYRHMRPWRPSQVLHIGLADAKDVKISAPAVGTSVVGVDGSSVGIGSTSAPKESSSSNLHFYLQWCRFHESMTRGSQQSVLKIDANVAFSSTCESIWSGDLL